MKNLEVELKNLFADSVFKNRKLKPSPRIRKELEERAGKYHFAALFETGGGVFLRRNPKGQLIAAVVITQELPSVKSKQAQSKFMILSMPGDLSSLKWAQAILEQNVSLLSKVCKGRLESWQTSLVPWFEKNNIKIRSVQLNGEIETSLKRLRAHYGKSLREPFESAGLVIRPALKKAEIEAYLRILFSEYSRNPQFGVFVANPLFLGYIRKDMMTGIAKGKDPLWLVYKGKELIGGVDITELPKGIDGQTRAAFGVNLVAKAQGKQIARAVYETILQELKSRGIKTYFGNTGQPGVVRLGKIMGRRLSGVDLDRGVSRSFPKGHFKSWL